MTITATKTIAAGNKSITRTATAEVSLEELSLEHEPIAEKLWRLVQAAKPSYSEPATPEPEKP